MNFWNEHSVMFILGIIFMPRMMLLWFGLIAPQSVSPIVGMIFVPRMFLASTITTTYGNTNSTLIVFIWIFAVAFDLLGIITKLSMSGSMMKQQMAAFEETRRRQAEDFRTSFRGF